MDEPSGHDTIGAAVGSVGTGLPPALQSKFEASLGADLSGVRVHTGESSAAAAHESGAQAYTVGQDIHFNAGQFDPHSRAGEELRTRPTMPRAPW